MGLYVTKKRPRLTFSQLSEPEEATAASHKRLRFKAQSQLSQCRNILCVLQIVSS